MQEGEFDRQSFFYMAYMKVGSSKEESLRENGLCPEGVRSWFLSRRSSMVKS